SSTVGADNVTIGVLRASMLAGRSRRGPRMTGQPTLESATRSELALIGRRLDENGLPSDDVEEHLGGFLVARIDGDVVGFVGVEPHGGEALLRSLSVLGHKRGHGIGRALCAGAETLARGTGARELYLL